MANTEILSPSAPEIKTLGSKEASIREALSQAARVTDFKKGYISAPFVNQLIDPLLQGYAADLIARHAKGLSIDKVVPIPNSGIPLATAVAERLKLPLAPGRKDNSTPGAWGNPVVIEEQVQSFTTGTIASFTFNELNQGDTILLVDDVVAYGDTSTLIIRALEKRGINVAGLAIYFGKHFQPGLARIKKETGITPLVVVGIERITPKGEIFLSPPHF